MIKKLKENGGFSVVEMLCAVIILVLLCLMTNSGLVMAMRSYRDVTAESETQLLLNDLSDALADRLRYAIVTEKDDGTFTCFDMPISTPAGTMKQVVDAVVTKDGMVQFKTTHTAADGTSVDKYKKLLSTGVYGSKRPNVEPPNNNRRYEVTEAEVTAAINNVTDAGGSVVKKTVTFTVNLEVKDTSGHVSMSADLAVRCLNPVKKEDEP